MKKIFNILNRVLLIIVSIIAFVPALIILMISDIREENKLRQLCGKGFAGKSPDKKGTKGKHAVADSYQFVG